MTTKISVIGPGEVALESAARLAASPSVEVVLCDPGSTFELSRDPDFSSRTSRSGRSLSIRATTDPRETANSGILVMTRSAIGDDVSAVRSFLDLFQSVILYSPDPILVVEDPTSNLLCDIAVAVGGFSSSGRVIGTGTMADSDRLARLIGTQLRVPSERIQALALGDPGPSALPLVRFATISGAPVLELLDIEEMTQLIDSFRSPVGAGIDSLAWRVASIERLVSALSTGMRDFVPSAVCLGGEYGIDGVFVSVPAVVGPHGVERVVELDLSLDELIPLRLMASAAHEKALAVTGALRIGSDDFELAPQ